MEAAGPGVGSGDVGVLLLLSHLLSQPKQDGGQGARGSLLSSACGEEVSPDCMHLETTQRLRAPQPGVGDRGPPDQAWEPLEAT